MREIDMDKIDLRQRVRALTHREIHFCHTMAYDASLDGKCLPFAEGITLLQQTGMPLILLLDAHIAVFQAEAELRKPPRFLLHKSAQ